jgi:predicted RNA-binding Zn-ribbon protein involved in translation (DUF1610 family)
MDFRAVPSDVATLWATLDRRMRQATWLSAAILAMGVALLVFLLVPGLWRPWIEWTWSVTIGILTLILLVSQWRLASFMCPRCGGSWLERRWFLASPFGLYRSHCANCGLAKGTARWDPPA